MNYLNKMEHFKKEILKTTDGSNTIYIPELDETYHSHHGALAESKHIFIETGLKHIDKKIINVFEVGFGTGLNAMLTCWLQIINESIMIQLSYILSLQI